VSGQELNAWKDNHLGIVAVFKQHTEKELNVLDVIYLELKTNELER
jgi:hypothetical protein